MRKEANNWLKQGKADFIPADLYDKEKSHRILEITERFFEWLMKLEDLKGL